MGSKTCNQNIGMSKSIIFFIFPYMIMYILFIYSCDVAKMVIIHKKITTFGYRQVCSWKFFYIF